MDKLIVVGQDTSNNCLIAKFSGTVWSVDTSFPTINGRLWGVFYYSSNNFWVCGGTGNGGLTAPILYHFLNGSWINHSSDFSDAKWFYSIAGNTSESIYVSGITTSDVGGVWKYTGTWTSSIINTDYALGVPNAGGQYPHLAVDNSGNAFTANWIYISSNKSVATWELFHQTDNSQSVQIRHVGNGDLLVCNNIGGAYPPVRKYIGSTGVWSLIGPANFSSVVIGAKSLTHYCFYFASDQKVYEYVGSTNTIISAANYFSNSNRYIYATDDLWVCGSTYANGTWDLSAQLSHYETGTTWSGPTDYNVDGLGSAIWCDIMAELVVFQPPSPCNVDYIDSDFTLNHYICHPTQRKATDGQRVVVAPFSIANPSIKIRRK